MEINNLGSAVIEQLTGGKLDLYTIMLAILTITCILVVVDYIKELLGEASFRLNRKRAEKYLNEIDRIDNTMGPLSQGNRYDRDLAYKRYNAVLSRSSRRY